VVGHTYMLAPREVLWEKQLSKEVELLLQKQGGAGAKRDPSRVVTFNVKAGHVVQVYNYQSKRSRVLVGPALVMLGPEEQFTVMRLSGGTPKIPNKVCVAPVESNASKYGDLSSLKRPFCRCRSLHCDWGQSS